MLKSTSGKVRVGIIIAFIVVLAIAAIGWFVAIPFFQGHSAKGDVEKEESIYVTYDGTYTDILITDAASAIDSLNVFSEDYGFVNATEVFIPAGDNTIDSRTYYHTQQIYNGIEVYGRSMVVVAGDNGVSQGASGNYLAISNIETNPKVTEQEAMDAAEQYLVKKQDCNEDFISSTAKGLVIYSIGADPILAYEIKANGYSDTYVSMSIFVDAKSGKVIDALSEVCSAFEKARGQDDSEYDIPYEDENGQRLMIDKGRNLQTYTNKYKKYENIKSAKPVTSADNNKSAIDAMGNMARTYDFFSNTLNRTQFDNRNSKLPIYVNILGADNAYFSYDSDTGEGWMSFVVSKKGSKEYSRNLDVVAHEFTHGVSDTVVSPEGLIYRDQSGAINEAVSDIFGEIVEHNVTGHCDWRNVIRNYTNKKTMDNYVWTSEDNGGVHTNSLIIDYVAYNIGVEFLGTEGAPKGRVAEFAKLWYGTEHMIPSDCTMNEFGTATVRMAEYMMSDGLLTSIDVENIRKAFTEAGITTDLNSSRIEPPQYDEEDNTNIPEEKPTPEPEPDRNAGDFNLIGKWDSGQDYTLEFFSNGEFTYALNLGEDWGEYAETGTYTVGKAEGNSIPINFEGTSILTMMTTLYGAVNSNYHFEILVKDNNNIRWVQVYGDYTVDTSPCSFPLKRVS
ncbi:MAG: M4 family metallopeptidase [Clostridiales Family XIII bacterium]|jgi:thermolysin|nr:M4 family metallopeptidase [Clostridiales Family XIII bacterium]